MIEAYAAGARALAVLACAHLIGVSLFLLRAGAAPTDDARDWGRRWRRGLPYAALLLLAALLLMLHAQACAVAGRFAAPGLTLELARETAAGRWWCARTAVAFIVLLASVAAAAARGPVARRGALLAVLASAVLATGVAPLSGHAAGTQDARWLVPLHVVHLIALCAWLGALPAWVGLARTAGRTLDPLSRAYAWQALDGFSRLAGFCMALIVVSGLCLALAFIADQGDVLGTRYGLLLCAKLGLLTSVLWIANTLRRRLLPTLRHTAVPDVAYRQGAARVRREWGIALMILVLGAGLAQTPPAIHADPRWWLPFRLSLEATWPDPVSRIAIWLGAASLAFGAVFVLRSSRSRGLRSGMAALALAGVAILGWGLSVTAYPDTYRRPPVPYLTLSIDQGRRAFAAHCTACHGPGGLGDGPLATSTRKPPANLSEPHTALHTPGDLYWWITHGMPKGPMPGFAGVLDDEQRWDLVNFLHTFALGYQARVLGPQIIPSKPWLGAPDFYYERADGSAQLKDLRGQRAALLVFTAPGETRSRARLHWLKQQPEAGFDVIVPQTQDVWQAYQFLTRTLTDRGAADRLGMPTRHVEFLVDRFGYIRARWIPADDATPWASGFSVRDQVARLAQEPRILAPPDLHLH